MILYLHKLFLKLKKLHIPSFLAKLNKALLPSFSKKKARPFESIKTTNGLIGLALFCNDSMPWLVVHKDAMSYPFNLLRPFKNLLIKKLHCTISPLVELTSSQAAAASTAVAKHHHAHNTLSPGWILSLWIF